MISTKYSHLKLKVLENDYIYVLFDSSEQFNNALLGLNQSHADFFCFSFRGEKSLICSEKDLNFKFLKSQGGWSGIKIEGEMPFGTVQGLISTITSTLSNKGIGACVISTFLTDLFLVKKSNLSMVKEILSNEGWEF